MDTLMAKYSRIMRLAKLFFQAGAMLADCGPESDDSARASSLGGASRRAERASMASR